MNSMDDLIFFNQLTRLMQLAQLNQLNQSVNSSQPIQNIR